MKRHLINIFLCSIVTTKILAQDIHWSQPQAGLLYMNAAFTGINSGFSANMNYRDQWYSLNAGFKTYMLGTDYRLGKNHTDRSVFSIGGVFFNDIAGGGKYTVSNGGITMSCILKAGQRTRIGGGLGYNRVRTALQANTLSWGSQFDGQKYDPSLTSGELENRVAVSYSDLNAGVSYIYEEKDVTAIRNHMMLMAGYSVNHFNRPRQLIVGGNDRLSMKHSFYLNAVLPLNPKISLKPVIFFYREGTMQEITAGSLVSYVLAKPSRIRSSRKEPSLSMGALVRVNDAVIPTMEFSKDDLVFGISYDVNISKLSIASRFRGGLELSVRYIASTIKKSEAQAKKAHP
jgi:type IX secretion system PorP/SprF family membrane protein